MFEWLYNRVHLSLRLFSSRLLPTTSSVPIFSLIRQLGFHQLDYLLPRNAFTSVACWMANAGRPELEITLDSGLNILSMFLSIGYFLCEYFPTLDNGILKYRISFLISVRNFFFWSFAFIGDSDIAINIK
jgi:hypothetical protein